MKFIKDCIWKMKTERMHKNNLPHPWARLPTPTPSTTVFCGLDGAESLSSSIPQRPEERSRLLHSRWTWVQSSSHCIFGACGGISRDHRPSLGRIRGYLPYCCRPRSCPKSGLCSSKMHTTEKARQRRPIPQWRPLVTLPLRQLSSKLCQTHLLSSRVFIFS